MSEITRPSDSQCSCRAVQSSNLDAVAACREIRTLGAWVPEIDIRIWTECAQRDWKPGVVLTLTAPLIRLRQPERPDHGNAIG